MRTAFCSGCMRDELIDKSWHALWIDSEGRLSISKPEHGCDLDFERPDTVFACGQGSVLVLVERYLHSGSFAHALDQCDTAESDRLPDSDSNEPFNELT